MFVIRELKEEEMKAAVDMRIQFWSEEIAPKAEYHLQTEEEVRQIWNWKKKAKKDNDYRVLLGAFENHNLVGWAGASYSDDSDSANGVELNYLFVEKNHRGKGIALKLLFQIIDIFNRQQCEDMIVYNFNISKSNSFYKMLGGNVIRQDYQEGGKLLTDIFQFDLYSLYNELKEKLPEYRVF